MGRQASSSSAAQPSSSLTLDWALGQLNKQLGGLETQPCRVQSSVGKLSPCKAPLPTGSSSSSQELACMTPSTSDVGTRPLADRQHSQRSPAPSLSVHWADALEQHSQACAHAPHHAHHTPDKPCLKAQPSSCFPFLEEASGHVDASLKRPCDDCSSDQLAAVKKRSRVAAFGL